MSPSLFFVIGPAGSGKSSVSKVLAGRIGAAYIDKDSVATFFTEAMLELAGTDPSERDNNDFYQRVVMTIEYRTLLRIAGDNLRLGISVVLDAPFVRYFSQADFLEAASRDFDWPDDARKVVVHVTVDSGTVRERVGHRGLARDGWKLGHWDEFWASAQAAECRWRGAHHVLFDNSSDGLSEQALDRAIAALA